MGDPREAKTLGDAAMNPDGTYNAFKALSWLSEAMRPGKGLPEDEVRKIADEVIAKRAAQAIEARRAATTGAVHESAVGETDAPKAPEEGNSNER